eukprot:6645743-Ditylum_brightwellii.AAC.1
MTEEEEAADIVRAPNTPLALETPVQHELSMEGNNRQSDDNKGSGTSSTGGGGTTTTSLVMGVPTVEQVKQAALKAVNECLPQGGMRGYQMACATHGVECNGLQKSMQEQLIWEEFEEW